MKFNAKTILTLVFSVLVVSSMAAPVAAQSAGDYPLNPEADEHPDTYVEEDELVVESHNRTTMSWLEYEDDNGKLQQLDAHVNGTDNSSAMVGYRADKIEDSTLNQFPIKSSEDGNNTVTWLNTGDWTESSASISVSDTDGSTASGVQSIQIATDGSMSSGASENVKYTAPSITSDAEKRYLQLVANVDSLDSATVVEVQVRDGDGDYVAPTIDSSATASSDSVIATQTASGVIYQEQLGQLAVQGTGDGSLDAVEEVRIVTKDGDATVTLTGLNVQKKSTWDFGSERVLDTSTDETGDYTDQEVENRPEGGVINATSLQPMGDTFADATVHDLTYYDVRYGMSDHPETVQVEWTDAEDYPNYPYHLELTWNRSIETAYDLSHGNMELHTEQSFLSERYQKLRYAEGTGDKNASEISDSSWIDLTGSLGSEGKMITADSTVQPDTTYTIQTKVQVLEDQRNNLESTQQAGGGGFWGGNSGGGNPFTSVYNWVAGGVVSLLGMLGIRRAGA